MVDLIFIVVLCAVVVFWGFSLSWIEQQLGRAGIIISFLLIIGAVVTLSHSMGWMVQ